MAKKDSFILIYRKLLRGDKFRVIGYPAKFLFFLMKDSLFDDSNGHINTNEYFVKFGPLDAEACGMGKATYYRALRELLTARIIDEVTCGGHGKRAIYDLSAWEWA